MESSGASNCFTCITNDTSHE